MTNDNEIRQSEEPLLVRIDASINEYRKELLTLIGEKIEELYDTNNREEYYRGIDDCLEILKRFI